MALAKTVSTLTAETLAKLRQPVGNYDRFSQVNILSALNDANLEVASRLKCIHGFAILIIKAGYSQYLPPSDMILPKDAFFYQNAQSYINLTSERNGGWKSRSWLDRYLPGWRTMASSTPYHAYMGDSLGYLRKIGFTPTPNTNGTNYVAAPDLGVVTSAQGMTTTGNITGISQLANATVCTDLLGRTLASLGIQVGMMALNVTDGSKGQISNVAGATFTVTLAGGTANAWRIGDAFVILAGEYGVVTSWDSPEQYVFSSDLGGMIDIQALTGNVYLEYYRQPLELIYDIQYPEIPQELHTCLPDGAVWQLKRSSTKGSDDANDAQAAMQSFEKGIGTYTTVDQATEPNFVRQNW